MDTAVTTELREAYGTGKARRFVLRESECEGFNPLKLRIRMFGSFGITVLAAPNDVVIALANATAFVFKWELLWKGFDDNENEDEDISKFSIGWIQITEHRKRKAKCAFYIFCDFILLVVYCYCAPSRALHGLTSTLFASIARFNHVLLSFSLARL